MRLVWLIEGALTLCLAFALEAQVTNTTISTADAFLCTGSSNNPELGGADLSGLNFGAAGTLAVAPPSSPKGEFQSVVRFETSNAAALFNSTYGSNHWLISSMALVLTSNDGAAGEQPNNGIFPPITGGKFVITWLSNNNWPEGTGTPNLPSPDGVTYDSLPDLLAGQPEILCTNTYSPPGDNVPVIYPLPSSTNLFHAVTNGSAVSFLFYAADDQIGYLFNSYNYGRGNEPLLQIVATPLLKILSATFENGNFFLTGIGADDATYQIQASANLAATNWPTIATVTSDATGAIEFHEGPPAGQTQRYFRIAQ